MKNPLIKNILYALAISVCAFPLAAVFFTAHAQSFNVEISPAKVNLTVEPGDNHQEIFRVTNNSGADKTFYMYVRDFTVSSETGSPTFFEGPREVNEQYSLKEWVSLPYEQIKVLDQQTREVPVTVSVPTSAEPGGHYAAVFFQTEDPTKLDDSSSVGAVGRIASLLLVTVPGDIDERIILQSFKTDKDVYLDPSQTITVTSFLENLGSVHGVPTGALFVSGGMNAKSKNIIFNQNQGAVLPGAPARKLVESFVLESNSFIPPMGQFKIELIARYGSNNNPVEGIATFWVIPWKFLSITLLLLILFGFLVWRVVLSFKK